MRRHSDESTISLELSDVIDWSESELDKDGSGSSTSDSSSENSIGIQENGSSAIIPSYMTTQVLESIRESSHTNSTDVRSIEACEINDQACIYGRITTMILIDLTDSFWDRSKFRNVQKRIVNLLDLKAFDVDVSEFNQNQLETYCYELGYAVSSRLRSVRLKSVNDFDAKVRQLYKIIAECRQHTNAYCFLRCIMIPFTNLYRYRRKLKY